MPDNTPEEIEARIRELEEKREKIESQIAGLMTKKSAAESVQLEDFEAMSPSQKRELKERAPNKYQELQSARADKGLEKLAETNVNGSF